MIHGQRHSIPQPTFVEQRPAAVDRLASAAPTSAASEAQHVIGGDGVGGHLPFHAGVVEDDARRWRSWVLTPTATTLSLVVRVMSGADGRARVTIPQIREQVNVRRRGGGRGGVVRGRREKAGIFRRRRADNESGRNPGRVRGGMEQRTTIDISRQNAAFSRLRLKIIR